MPWVKYVNTPIQYLLGSIIVACFLFSMGNKPRASKWKYKTASLVFAVLIVYLMFASAMCAVAAARQGGSANSVMLFSTIITFGLYAASSLLAFDPWHIITSSLAYLLLSPTFINVLSIYAFSNLDDMSWGTKQDSVPEIADLGAVVQDSQAKVEVETTDTIDRNASYEEAIQNLKYRKPVAPKPSSPAMTEAEREQKAKDYYANVRTNVLLLWALSNGVLLVGILGSGSPSKTMSPETNGANLTKGYMIFILSFTALTNIIRFCASTLYLLIVFITG
jgi:chitin synthase